MSYSENALVEQPTIALFAELGWRMVSVMEEVFGPSGTLGRETSGDLGAERRDDADVLAKRETAVRWCRQAGSGRYGNVRHKAVEMRPDSA